MVEFFLDLIKAVLSEAAAFLVLALIVSWMFREKLVHAMDRGLQYIGDSLSTTFVTHVLPEFRRGREALEKHFPPVPVIEMQSAPAPPEIKEKLKIIRQEISGGALLNFDRAERQLLELREKHPDNIAILDMLTQLYWHPRYNKTWAALEALKGTEDKFSSDPLFYSMLASTYARLKGDLPLAFKNAVEAMNKSVDLEPNNPKWRRLLGYVYYWFDDLERAIPPTEKALKMAEAQQNREAIAWCKNNLAYYYAMEGKPENRETAIRYAKAAYAYDPNDSSAIDTLGYVTLKYAQSRNDVQEAIKLFNSAMEREPRDIHLTHLKEAFQKLQEGRFKEG